MNEITEALKKIRAAGKTCKWIAEQITEASGIMITARRIQYMVNEENPATRYEIAKAILAIAKRIKK
jgi:hypothetical protein